jgi:hypothetical protein
LPPSLPVAAFIDNAAPADALQSGDAELKLGDTTVPILITHASLGAGTGRFTGKGAAP